MRQILVALPAFNEEQSIGELLVSFQKVFEQQKIDYFIIVVNDGSTDKTEEIVKKYVESLPLKIVNHPQNRGLGQAILTGIKEAFNMSKSGDDVIINMDSDNTHSPDFIPDMLKKIEDGADLVIASRYQAGSKEIGVPFLRKIYSRGAKFLFQIFFNLPNVRDYTCGYRAYRVKLIESALKKFGNNLISRNGFACTDELLIHLATLTDFISEIPFILRYDKKKGKSKLKLATTIKETIKLLFKGRRELQESRKQRRKF